MNSPKGGNPYTLIKIIGYGMMTGLVLGATGLKPVLVVLFWTMVALSILATTIIGIVGWNNVDERPFLRLIVLVAVFLLFTVAGIGCVFVLTRGGP